MIHCPHCDAATPVLLECTYDAHTRTTTRHMLCANSHRFTSKEVPAAMVAPARERRSALSAIERRVQLWVRDRAILRDLRPLREVAAEHGLTEARVRQIRASG